MERTRFCSGSMKGSVVSLAGGTSCCCCSQELGRGNTGMHHPCVWLECTYSRAQNCFQKHPRNVKLWLKCNTLIAYFKQGKDQEHACLPAAHEYIAIFQCWFRQKHDTALKPCPRQAFLVLCRPFHSYHVQIMVSRFSSFMSLSACRLGW